MIKLRAWDKKRKCYQKLMMLNMEDDEVIFSYKRRVESEPFKDFDVEQYTGLKDSNGVEIFEGDIVIANDSKPDNFRKEYDYKDKVLSVEFSKISHGFVTNDMCHGLQTSLYEGMDEIEGVPVNYQYEVIGNIHENPELLEEE